ncbi:MAG: DMT family transporter [Actinomycetota bacterium]
MIYGLGAALGWGLADVTAAVSGRRIGSLRTVVIAQLASLVVLGVVVAIFRPPMGASSTQIAILLVGGVLGAGAYLSLYKGLALGPVALVSPIVAAYAAITIVLAVVFLHERLTGLALLGTVLALVGVVLTATDPRALRRGGSLLGGGGIPWGISAMLLFGVATFVLGRVSQDIGWAAPTVYSRIGDVAVIVLVGVVLRRRMRGRRLGAQDLTLAFFVGMTDILGVISYARGAELGYISIVTAASVAFIVIPVVAGFVMFRERPAPSQIAGIVVVAGGLVALGMGS